MNFKYTTSGVNVANIQCFVNLTLSLFKDYTVIQNSLIIDCSKLQKYSKEGKACAGFSLRSLHVGKSFSFKSSAAKFYLSFCFCKSSVSVT